MIALIVLACSVPALGVFAALAIYGVRRYLAAAKTAEAKTNVTVIAQVSQSAYERRVAELGDEGGRSLCRSADPVPASVPRGKKYVSVANDWQSGDAASGWRCLRFSISVPQYYQYHYVQGGDAGVRGASPGSEGFEAAAVGDLDADGMNGVFVREGRIESGSLVVDTQIVVDSEFE